MKFYIYKYSKSSNQYAVVADEASVDNLPVSHDQGEWLRCRVVSDDGKPRVGFNAEKAKAEIQKQGFHLFKTEIAVKEVAD